jgi:hypothetical protein
MPISTKNKNANYSKGMNNKHVNKIKVEWNSSKHQEEISSPVFIISLAYKNNKEGPIVINK